MTTLGGRYRIDGLIGRGGMATVWRATDTVLGREVAVKRLHARLHGDTELEERFRREGRLVANLSHPNIVRLLDQGDSDDEPYLVFELVDGRDLKTMLRQTGRIVPERAAAIVAQVARGLAVAHRAGVVHRDIKSHNVLVTNDGAAKLTDFGIARIVEAEGDLTRTGIVIGSSDYLSPEQAEGKPLDGRSDIYSLGVVLYEALTGRLPFTGDNPVAVATKHVYDEAPDPRAVVPEIPEHLARTCLTALAKDPRQRFATGDDFAEALGGGEIIVAPAADDPTTSRMHAVGGRPRPGDRGPRRRRLGLGLATAGAVAALAVAGAVWGPGLIDGGPDARATGETVPFTAVDFDPQGDDAEHPEQVALLTDGDPATEWSTESYQAGSFFGTKSGVGLKLTFTGGPAVVRRVRITSSTPGATVRILGAGEDVDTRPPLGEATLNDGVTEIPVADGGAQADVVVWITGLTQSGSDDGRYRTRIGQVDVLGAANT